MTKYIARVSHERHGVHYRRKTKLGLMWIEDIEKAHRFDTREEALESASMLFSDWTKEALVAPEDRIYAAARSRRTGTLRYRTHESNSGKWYLSPDPKLAHEFNTRFWASQSFNGLNNQAYDFKVGTMDEIQKWYDQFGKPEAAELKGSKPSTMFIDESHWLRQPLAHLHLTADGKVTVNQNRHFIGVEMAEPKKPEPADKYEASRDHMVEFGIDPVVAKYAVELRRIYDAREAGAHTFSGVLHAFLAAFAEEHE